MIRELLQQALDVLEALQGGCTDSDDGTVEAITVWCPELIDDIRAALAAPVEPVAQTRFDEDSGEEAPERRRRDRSMDDARIDHIFHGFDMVILNGDEYTKGYARAMRKEFAELVETLIAIATPPAQPAPLDGFGGNLDSAFDAPAAPLTEDCPPNHFCNRRFVHLPRGEQCDRCGHE